MKLLDFYKGILLSVGLSVDDHGKTYVMGPTGDDPYMLKDKNKGDRRLILPTEQFLKDPDWDNYIAFHPLSENVVRKDSLVLQTLQSLVNIDINVNIDYVMSELLRYCVDTDLQTKLTPKQNVFLSSFPDADETSLKNWNKINAKINPGVATSNEVLARLVTMRNKKLNGTDYQRVTLVSFPIYNELCKMVDGTSKDYVLFGVKLRKKDVFGFKGLLEYLIRDIETPDELYSFGSRSLIAPSFHSLMNSFYLLKKRLNKTIRLLKIDACDLDWGKELDDLNKFKGVIPPLDGNEGDVTEGERRRQERTITPKPQAPTATIPVAPVVPQVQQPGKVPTAPVQPMVQPQVAPVQPVQPLLNVPLQQPVQTVQQVVNPYGGNVLNTTTRTKSPKEIPVAKLNPMEEQQMAYNAQLKQLQQMYPNITQYPAMTMPMAGYGVQQPMIPQAPVKTYESAVPYQQHQPFAQPGYQMQQQYYQQQPMMQQPMQQPYYGYYGR